MRPGHFLAIAALVLAGCPSSSECERDLDCGGGEVCANTHECLPASGVRRVEIQWTLYGQQASTETCGNIDHLEVSVSDVTTGQRAAYSPVPCDPGKFVFAKLPVGYDNAGLSVYIDERFVERMEGVFDGTGVVRFDFEQGSPPAFR